MEGASGVPLAVAHVRRFRSLLPTQPHAPSDGELGEAEPVPEDLAPEGAADPAPAPAPDAAAVEPGRRHLPRMHPKSAVAAAVPESRI